MIYLFTINELSLIKLLFFILLRRDIRVLRIAPILPQTKIMLAKIIQGLSKKKYISYAIESFPDLEKYQKFERRFYFDEAFKRYEGWQDVYYKFDKVSKASKDEYVYGFKNITCSYTFWKVLEIHLIKKYFDENHPKSIKLVGVGHDTLSMFYHYFNQNAYEKARPIFHWVLLNTFLAIFSIIFSLFWIFSRVRIGNKSIKIDIAFDKIKSLI